MNNEPVAIRYDFDGYGYRYIDSGSGSDWASLNKNVDGEFLYTHPVKELTDKEIHNLMDEIEILVHGDIKRAMYRMARKVESILNE